MYSRGKRYFFSVVSIVIGAALLTRLSLPTPLPSPRFSVPDPVRNSVFVIRNSFPGILKELSYINPLLPRIALSKTGEPIVPNSTPTAERKTMSEEGKSLNGQVALNLTDNPLSRSESDTSDSTTGAIPPVTNKETTTRIIEKQPIYIGLDEKELSNRLAALASSFLSQTKTLASKTELNDVYRALSQTNRIDQLRNVTFSGSVTGLPSTGTTFDGNLSSILTA